MTRAGYVIVGLAFVLGLSARPLHASPAGTGSFTVNVGESTGNLSGDVDFDDQIYNVIGNFLNMSLANPTTFTGQLINGAFMCTNTNTPCTSDTDCSSPEHCQLRNGTFVTNLQSSSCTGCAIDCTACDPGCPLCLVTNASFLCSPQGCLSGQQNSFVGDIVSAAGTILGSLPPDISFTSDGTGTFQSQSCGSECVDTHTGRFGINAFESLPTPTGSNVGFSLPVTFFNSSTGKQVTVVTSITFDNVTAAGTTTVTGVSNAAGALPDGFAANAGFCSGAPGNACETDTDCATGQTCDGYHAAFFDISTTATFSGDVTICSFYPDVDQDGIVDDTELRELTLRMMHRPSPGANFEDVTLPGYPDPVGNEICGKVSTLSPFVLAFSTNIPGGTGVKSKTDCINEFNAGLVVSVTRKGIPKHKVVCKDNDPTCDMDPTLGTCGFDLSICPNQSDVRLPNCTPTDIADMLLIKPSGIDATDPVDALNAYRIAELLFERFSPNAFITILDPVEAIVSPPATSNSCLSVMSAAGMPIEVPLKNGTKTGKRVIKLRATTSSGVQDTDTITLICEP